MAKIFNTESNTIPEGFGYSAEHFKLLAEKYFNGSYADILDKICNDNPELTDGEKYGLLVNFGTQLVFSEVNAMAEGLKKDDDSKESIGTEDTSLQ